ncbi:MAG: glycosyltransferase family 4 protein [Bacteroidota bacterium]
MLPSPAAPPVSPRMPATLLTLQIGMGWFPEQAGGLNRMYYHLMHALPEAGVGVHGIVAGSTGLAAQTHGRVRSCARADAPMPTRLWQARTTGRRMLQALRPDVLVSHFALYTAPLLGAMNDQPLVVHFHGPWAAEGAVEGASSMAARAKWELEQQVYRRADRFIVLSEAFRDVLHSRYDVALDKIEIVPGGVDASAFDSTLSRKEARELLGWPTDRPTVLAVRRLQPRMGLEGLIDAVETVRQQVPDVQVMIAGKGALAATLQAQIEARGLSDHVKLLGFVPDADLPLAYRAADVSIVPTVALEGFGLITIESLAAGTPVLVTPIGGLPETVRGLDASLILDDAAPATVADALAGALTGARPLPDADACQAYARATFDWPVIAAKTAEVYRAVV